jgi:hypothetical protein
MNENARAQPGRFYVPKMGEKRGSESLEGRDVMIIWRNLANHFKPQSLMTQI